MRTALVYLSLILAAHLFAGCGGASGPAPDAGSPGAADAASGLPDGATPGPDACLPQAAGCAGSQTRCCEPFTCGTKKGVCCSIGGVPCESVDDCCGAPMVGGIGWACEADPQSPTGKSCVNYLK